MDATTLPEKPIAPPHSQREAPRRLWQAPVFVLGVGAILCLWFCQPYLCQPNRCDTLVLDKAREDLGRDDSDPEAIADRLQRLLDRGNLPEELAGSAHFLYGSAKIRVAQSVSAGLARDHWNTAREQLLAAEQIGVPDADRALLQYRLGKVGFYLQSEPADKVAERLAASITAADDKAEGYQLLSQAYLRLTPPNLQAALDANEQLRQLMVPEDVLARARLTGGEILLRMHHPDDARKVLEKIGNQAPSPILTKARMLRAQSKQDENQWADAATLWQAALTDAPRALPEADLIRYNLGLCYLRLEQPQTAAPFWEDCVRNSTGDEGRAAALGLAELQVQEGKADKTVERLELALRGVRTPADWDKKLVERNKACAAFERCCQLARQAGKFALAMQIVALYEHLAAPGRALVMRGDIASDWARARRDEQKKPNPAAQADEDKIVRDLFSQAADAYEQAAKQAAGVPERGDYLWQATTRYLDAGEQAKAQALLTQLFDWSPRPDARLAEGWYLLGESFRKEARPGALDHDTKISEAERAYKECVKYQTPFEFQARYRLAQFKIDRGMIDEAATELEQIIRLLPGEESEVKQQARFTLVHLCYEAKKPEKYKTVVDQMEQVLEHLPVTPEATLARFELADSYRLLADEQDRLLNDGTTYREQGTRDHYAEIRDNDRKRAIKEYENVLAIVEKPESKDYLKDETRRNLYYFSAYTCFQMGLWDKSLAAYERMAQRYRGKPNYWTAVAGMVSSYTGKGDVAMIRKGLDEIRSGLPDMDNETRKDMELYIRNVEMLLLKQPMR